MDGERVKTYNKLATVACLILIQVGCGDRGRNEYYAQGQSKALLGDKLGAIEDFTRAIEADPKFAGAFYGRGIIKSELGDTPGAIEDLTKAINLDPNDDRAYRLQAIKREREKAYMEALVEGQKAAEKGIGQQEPYGLSDFWEALRQYEKAIEIDPTKPDAYIQRGIVNQMLGKNEEACEDFRKAKKLGGKDAPDLIKRFCQ